MTKRWVGRISEFKEVPEIDAFLSDVMEVCRKHSMCISHEDGQGAFEVVDFDPHDEWLLGANDARSEQSVR